MIRYGIQYSDGSWEAIGKGSSPDVQDAHLMTRRDLAQAKIDQYVKSDWYKRMKKEGMVDKPKLVEFECNPITPNK